MNRLQQYALEAGKALVPLAIVLAGVAGFLLFGQRPQAEQKATTSDRPALVETATVESYTQPLIIEIDGVCEPFTRVTLSAEVAGRITTQSPLIKGGKVVQQGEQLLVINPTDYKLDVKRLEAQLRQANDELESVAVDITNTQQLVTLAEEDWELLKQELARNQRLASTSTVTKSVLDEVRRQELAGRNALQTLRNQLNTLAKRQSSLSAARDLVDVQLQQAKEIAKRTNVVSPVTGTVITAYVDEGEYVRAGDPLVEISASAPMEIRCNLRVEQLYWIWRAAHPESATRTAAASDEARLVGLQIPQFPVDVVYELQGRRTVFSGMLFRYEGTGLDEETRTIPCRVLVEQPHEGWHVLERAPSSAANGENAQPAGEQTPSGLPVSTTKPPAVPRLYGGMFVQVRIPVDLPMPVLRVPDSAYRPGDQIWTIRDGALSIVTVGVVEVQDEFVLVREDDAVLQAGDRVVTSPLAAVQDGMAVEEADRP